MASELTEECAIVLAYVAALGTVSEQVPRGPMEYLSRHGMVVEAVGSWEPTEAGLRHVAEWPERIGAVRYEAALDLVWMLREGRVRFVAANRIEVLAASLPWRTSPPVRSHVGLAGWARIRVDVQRRANRLANQTTTP